VKYLPGFVFLLILPLQLNAQQGQNPKPCYALPEYRQFDFWIGEWDVTSRQGQPLGQSKIELILDGCVIFENWYSAQGVYAGKSLNYYDRQSGKWHQKWIDNNGAPIEFTGSYNADDKALYYTAVTLAADGSEVMSKLTFYMINRNYVNQVWQQSQDGGRTWQTVFDGHYRRKI
jgi:hypothetical protein